MGRIVDHSNLDRTERASLGRETAALLGAMDGWPLGIVVTDTELDEPGPRIVYANAAFCEMGQCSPVRRQPRASTAAKLGNTAAQCATGCGLAGAACKNVAQSFARRSVTTARISNVGCTARGQFVAEADVCGLGMNRIYDIKAPESRACKVGKPTGFWALSTAQKSYTRDPANCTARGIR